MEADTEAPMLEGQRAVAPPPVVEDTGDNPPAEQPDMPVVEAAPLLQDRRRPRSNA